MATVACRICSTLQFQPRFRKNGFNIERCVQCGLIQVTNPPETSGIESHYEEEFFHEHYEKLLRDPQRQAYEYQKFNYRLGEIQKKVQAKGNILDVGCSLGFFLNAAQRQGWTVHGLELSDWASNYARAKFGIPVLSKPLEEGDFKPESFDVVTMWNVIEHLENPTSVVKTIHRILRPGGMMVFTTGNVESLLARIQNARWRMLIPPIHLSHFSPSTIQCLLGSCNFRLGELTCALPCEGLLKRLGLLGVFKSLGASDKMLIYATKPSG